MTNGGRNTAGWWADLPSGRVTVLDGASMDAILVVLDPLPETAPPVIGYQPGAAASGPDQVALILHELEWAALSLFPAWLSEAEHIAGPQGAGVAAVRTLAFERAAASHHFGPFLADLAECALRRQRMPAGAFAPVVRAAGLARVIAESYGRPFAVLLVEVPDGLTARAEAKLAAAAEWLAGHSGMDVWLTGAPLRTVDRFATVAPTLAGVIQDRTGERTAERPGERPVGRSMPSVPSPEPQAPTVRIPPIAGKPRPDSPAEVAIEAALAIRDWAAGRSWNQTYHPRLLAVPYRLDLWWKAERCVIEVDGPEHCAPLKYAADRRRDVELQLDGHAVLRYTNDQVLSDLHRVVSEIERLVRSRRPNSMEK